MTPPLASSESFDPSLFPAVYDLLLRLGVTENYKGFRYAAYAAALCAPSQDRLLLVTKWLYPDVADHFGTSWSCVERDLRTVIAVAWERNPALLANLAQCPLDCKPSCARFIAVLARYLSPDGDYSASAAEADLSS